jgi:hypothetical protein
MLKFLAEKIDRREDRLSPGLKRYSRFEPEHLAQKSPAPAVESPKPAPVISPPPQRRAVEAITRRVDENSHLYSDSSVSIATLRKALPKRFAALQNKLDSA